MLLQSIWISKIINIQHFLCRERLETFLNWEKHGKISTEFKENNLLCLYCPWLCVSVPTFEIPRQIERQRGLKRDRENKIGGGGGGGEGNTSVVTNIVKCKLLTVLSCSVSNKNFIWDCTNTTSSFLPICKGILSLTAKGKWNLEANVTINKMDGEKWEKALDHD